jgi:hypothetical protein
MLKVVAVIVNASAFDTTPLGLATVILTVPAEAISEAGMAAVNWVPLITVVVRLEPFHLTVDAAIKFAPLTVKVKAGPPAIAEVGTMPVRAGGASLTMRLKALVALAGVAWLSRTWTVKLEAPEAVGVPLKAPVPGLRASPAGSEPDRTDQV